MGNADYNKLCKSCGGSGQVPDPEGAVEEVACLDCDSTGWQDRQRRRPQGKPIPMEVFANLLRMDELQEQARKLRGELGRALVVKYLNQDNPEGGDAVGTVGVREYVKLRRAYEQATKDGLGEFTFKGHILLVPYCYYLLEYLHPIAVNFEVAGEYKYRGPAKRPVITEEKANGGQDKG